MNNRQQRLNFFLVVWFTMISCVSGWGQNPYPIVLKKDFSRLSLPGTTALQMSSNPDRLRGLDLTWGVVFVRSMNSERLYSVPSNIYYTQSGVICKMEWELEKASHIPFRVRLGSLADCNAMEGKR
jgi:hypothetical protein